MDVIIAITAFMVVFLILTMALALLRLESILVSINEIKKELKRGGR